MRGVEGAPIEMGKDFSFGEEILENDKEEGGLEFETEAADNDNQEQKIEKPKITSAELNKAVKAVNFGYDLDTPNKREELDKLMETYRSQNFELSNEDKQKIITALDFYNANARSIAMGEAVPDEVRTKFSAGANLKESLDERVLAELLALKQLNPVEASRILKWNLENKHVAAAAVSAYPQNSLEILNSKMGEEFYKDLASTALKQSPEALTFVDLAKNANIEKAAIDLTKDSDWLGRVIAGEANDQESEFEKIYRFADSAGQIEMEANLSKLDAEYKEQERRAMEAKDFDKIRKIKKQTNSLKQLQMRMRQMQDLEKARKKIAA